MTFYKVYGILISGEKIEKTLREAAMKKIIVVTPWDEPLAEVVAVREIHGEEMEIEPVKLTFSSSEAAIMFIRSHPEDFVYVKMTDMLCNQVMFEDIPFRKFIYGEREISPVLWKYFIRKCRQACLVKRLGIHCIV